MTHKQSACDYVHAIDLNPALSVLKRRFCTLIFALMLLGSGPEAISATSQPLVLHIDGSITENTLFEISQKLAGWSNEDSIPGGLLVLLNSPGGNGEAGMQIGRILRQKKAHTFVTGRCDSACLFVLAGGVARAARPGTVGVHAGRLTITDPNGKILKEIDASQSLTNSFKLTSFNSDIRKYFAEMGVAHDLLDISLAHRTRHTYRLSDNEMKRYRVVGFDNEYLRERAQFFENLPGPTRVNRIELYNRTLSVPQLCQRSILSNDAFINCYKSVLFQGFSN